MLLLGNFAIAQQFFFFGTHRPKENGLKYDCQNAKDYTLKEVTNYKDYQTLNKEFYTNHNNEWPYTLYLDGQKPFVIYKAKSFRKWENCTYTFIDCAQANTIEQVQDIIKKRKTEYQFENEQILYTHNPKPAEISKKIIEKNYGELSAKYTLINSANVNAVLAEFKNNSKDNALVITIYKKSKILDELKPNNTKNEEPQVITLQPKELFKTNLNTGNFDLEIYTREKDELKDNSSWIDWIEEQIKHHVIKDPDHKDNIESTAFGIRG